MLRASAEKTQRAVDICGIVDLSVDLRLTAGPELLAFTDAAVLRDDDEIGEARTALGAVVGDAGVVRAAAVAGNFEMMNRLLDAIGTKVHPSALSLADHLGLIVPDHLRPDA